MRHQFGNYATSQRGKVHRTWHCTCGKAVLGNLAKYNHRKACDGFYRSAVDVYRELKEEGP